MEYKHFVQFAAEMVAAECGYMMDCDNTSDANDTAVTVQSIATALVTAANCMDNKCDLLALATEIGMFEYLEAWADDDEFPLHNLASLYM